MELLMAAFESFGLTESVNLCDVKNARVDTGNDYIKRQ